MGGGYPRRRAAEQPLPTSIGGDDIRALTDMVLKATRDAYDATPTDQTGWAKWTAEELRRELIAYVRQQEKTTPQAAVGMYSHWQ